MMTLYCLRCPSGHLPDYIWYMYCTGQRKGIQYMYITCPISKELLSVFLMSDIGYPIKCDRRTVGISSISLNCYPLDIKLT